MRKSRGDLNLAAICLRHVLRIYPVEENLHQHLIKVLLMQGKRREAMKQFHSCVDILRNELDADPLPETLQLESLVVQPS